MATYHTKGLLANGQPLTLVVTADDPYAAATAARKEIVDAGHNPAGVTKLVIKEKEKAKSRVYVGAIPVRGARKGNPNIGAIRKAQLAEANGTAATPAAATPAAAIPAAPAAGKPNGGKK